MKCSHKKGTFLCILQFYSTSEDRSRREGAAVSFSPLFKKLVKKKSFSGCYCRVETNHHMVFQMHFRHMWLFLLVVMFPSLAFLGKKNYAKRGTSILSPQFRYLTSIHTLDTSELLEYVSFSWKFIFVKGTNSCLETLYNKFSKM